LSGKRSEPIKFRATELPRGRHPFAAAAAANSVGVERHRVFARADQDITGGIGHASRAFLATGAYSSALGCWPGLRRCLFGSFRRRRRGLLRPAGAVLM